MGSHEVKIPDKGSIQCVRGTNEFMAAEHKKLTDEISDFTRATLFEENTTWTVFCSVSEHPQLSEKAVDSPSVANYIFICVRLAFLPILQSKHHVTKD